MKNCEFPACKREATCGVFCYDHKRLMGVSGPVKQPVKIAKESDKMKNVKAELKKLYPIFLKSRPICEIASPVCTKKATCIHHVCGRLPSKILKQEHWMAACEHYNGWVENNDAESRSKGLKKSKF